jgi:hypothetical protein
MRFLISLSLFRNDDKHALYFLFFSNRHQTLLGPEENDSICNGRCDHAGVMQFVFSQNLKFPPAGNGVNQPCIVCSIQSTIRNHWRSQWGLGLKVGDTLIYLDEAGEEMKLKIIGGLANSIFQGNAIIDDQLFLKHFPSNSGSHLLLVDGAPEDLEENMNELSRAFRNEGVEIEVAADRLAMFNQVENTYLSIFMLLGGLAMILGTVGLGVSLARNILDRGPEIGILRAMGFPKLKVLQIITYEHLVLLLIGTLNLSTIT